MRDFTIDISKYKKQEDFILDTHFGVGFIGGWRSGKTYGGGIKSFKYILENPYACGLIIGPNYGILERAILPTYEEIFPPEIIKKKTTRPPIKWVGKRSAPFTLYFCSADKPENLACGEIAFSQIDEGSKSPLMAYRFMRSRMSQKTPQGLHYPYQFWVTTTPNQLNWVYKEIIISPDPNITCYVASTLENKYLNVDGFDSTDDAGVLAYLQRTGMVEGTKEYDQNILGKASILTGECLFSAEDLERQLPDCLEPLEVRNNGYVLIYKEPVVGVHYIAGADCADEGGEGVNNLVILDPQTGDEVAEIYADIPADKFAEMSAELCSEYNNALLAPERNGIGNAVIQKLRDIGYSNLYKDDKGRDGWYTSTNALPPKVDRLTMLKEYEEAVRLRRTVIRSSDAIGEMSTFARNEKGKYKHLHGCMDDRVMSRAICWQLRKVRPRSTLGFASFKRLATTY